MAVGNQGLLGFRPWLPASGLKVAGNGSFSGVLTAGSAPTAVTNPAGKVLTTALANFVTAGTGNFGAGVGALQANTTGTQNTAFGASALQANTGESSNTAVGYGTLQANTTGGAGNTAVGSAALISNTTGFYCTCIGANAGFSNTTGQETLAVGLGALQSNVDGSFNVAVGNAAQLANVSGAQNVSLGHHSLYALNGGNFNVAVGNTAGEDVTTGSSNIFIGFHAGDGITTGGNNVVIGANLAALSATLAGAIVFGTGDGTIRLDYGKTTASRWTFGGTLVLPAGTATDAPVLFQSGTNLTTPAAGAMEFNGAAFYNTVDTTNGRRVIGAWGYFRLTGSGTGITTIADFFGANSAIPLVANGVYEIEWVCFFSQATAGTATWTVVTATTALANLTGEYVGSPVGGIGAVGTPQTAGVNVTASSSTAFPVTGSEATGATHRFRIRVLLTAGNGASNVRLRLTMSAGTATPLINSYFRVRRLPAGNTGTFVA